MVTPALTKVPRRLAAPAELGATPKLEMIHQPLYSAAGIDNGAALPRTLLFFQYGIGAVVAGAGTGAVTGATFYHTNMETAGFLAAPKVFVIKGIRVIFAQLDVATAVTFPDDTVGTTPEDTDWADDLAMMYYSGSFRIGVGPKDYVRCPLFLVPGNTGIEGVAAVAGSWATNNFMRINFNHTVGKYYSLPDYPVLIASQQSFAAEIRWEFGTNYQTADDHLVWTVLDGVLGREVA